MSDSLGITGNSEARHAAVRRAAHDNVPWVLVAGGFHELGGMDKANYALAAHLLARGHALHLVAHHVSPSLAAHARVHVHLVPRPAGSTLLGESLLAWRGRAVAQAVMAYTPAARVLTNGGNCMWPDINWAHSVHHAWPCADAGAPLWFKAKNRLSHALACRRERRAINGARFVVANSERTRRDLIEHLGVSPERVRVVYLGSSAEVGGPASPEERATARARLGLTGERPVVAFVGALGHDQNKGFDTLWRAWQSLSAREGWNTDLIVAGGGRGLEAWRKRVAAAESLGGRVRLLGFAERIGEVYAAADLLVSPARYEAYGLNVHEAICRGVPSLVSRGAGVAERYPAELSEMILPDPENYADLAARLRRWHAEVEAWKTRFAPLSVELRRRSWDAVAAEIVSFVEGETHAPEADAWTPPARHE